MKTLSIDLETYCNVDLTKAGVYRYAEDESFEILLFGVSVDSGPVTVYDLANGELLPAEIIDAVVSDEVIKWAFNASFERICLSCWIRKHCPYKFRGYSDENDTTHNYLNPVSWRCSMTWCAYLALPLSLEGAGAVLGLNQQKMKEGKDHIRYFCKPCSPTRTNRGRTRNMPWDAPEKWSLFESYNKRDVEVELSIKERLKNYPVPDFVWEEYHLSEHINDRGILIDKTLVENAIRFNELSKAELSEQMKQITDLENPNSVQQLRGWLAENGLETESLGKKDVAELMKTAPAQLQEVLSLRLLLSKSSIKKYEAMANSMCADGRCRGMFMFYGAARTGRFAGRIIQLQNLVRNSMPDLNQARELVKHGDYDSMAMLYDVPDALSQLIRTSFIPKPGYKFYVADYSAIEARVIA